MSNIRELIKQMKTDGEITAFIEAQYQSIVELTDENSKLQSEVSRLQNIVDTAGVAEFASQLTDPNAPREQIIAEVQLERLNKLSFERPLTTEESKQTETYHKILTAFRGRKKTEPTEVQKTSTADLLKLVTND